jgi:hypothetical protein
MEKWEVAVEKFLQKWKERDDIEGFMVCGSYVTGSPSERSDIDLYIVLSSGIDWRMRGNEIVDGFLIEYFVNPPEQIPEYFKEDYRYNSRQAAHMFVTGRVLYEKSGIVVRLQDEARQWMEKEFPELDAFDVENNKYGLWDTLDNLHDAYETGSPSFTYAYWNAIRNAFEFYSKYLKFERIPSHRIHEQLNDDAVMEKYMVPPYPDEEFKKLVNRANAVTSKKDMLQCFKEIV